MTNAYMHVGTTRADETRKVRNALKAAGMTVLKVGHGRGTAYGWVMVKVGMPAVQHKVSVNGTVQYLTMAEKQQQWDKAAAEYTSATEPQKQEWRNLMNSRYATCTADCPACELWASTRLQALRIVRETVNRPANWGDYINVQVEEVRS